MTSIVPRFSRDTAVIFFLAAAVDGCSQRRRAARTGLSPSHRSFRFSIAPSDCRYSLATDKNSSPVLVAGIAAEIDSANGFTPPTIPNARLRNPAPTRNSVPRRNGL